MKKLTRHREVSWEDPMVGAALALDLSGLDYLRAIAAGRVPPPPIAVLHATTTCLVFEPHQQAQSAGNGDGR